MLKGVLFDLDGVIIDTERDGHRVAFNQAFLDFGIPDAIWDISLYHDLLQIGGGKERIKYYFTMCYQGSFPPADLDSFAKRVHKHKTDIFLQMLPALPLRPGVHRFMSELSAVGIPMGICTTSNERVAETVSEKILSDIPFDFLIAGDMVKAKKPDPEIYNMSLNRLTATGDSCLVIEDSRIGVLAAKAAGCRVVATYNQYTKDEDLSPADCIVSCLGDKAKEMACVQKDTFGFAEGGLITGKGVQDIFLKLENGLEP